MIHKKVISQQKYSDDGKSVAEAQSIAISSGDNDSKVLQTITIKICLGNQSSSSSSSSSSSTSN